jgi:hypothetical protein
MVLGIGLVVIGAALPGPASAFNFLSLAHLADDTAIHYRISIDVIVDGKLLTRSAVQELRAHAELRTIPGTGGLSVSGAGEAVAVAVPGKRALYFPLVTASGSLFDQLQLDCKLDSTIGDPVQRLDVIRNFRGPCILSEHGWPLAVRFADETDPSTATAALLPEVNGPDGSISIQSVTIERTDQPLTSNIGARLPWAAGPKAIRIDILRPDGRILLATNSTIFARK